MKQEKNVTQKEMKEAIGRLVGSKFPVRITTREGKILVCYIRGFADPGNEVALVSDNSYSLAMKIVEIRNISVFEFSEGDDGPWKVFRAKWLRRNRLFAFLSFI